MSDEVDAQLAVARRREAALAGVLRAVGDAGDDLDAARTELHAISPAFRDALRTERL